MLRTMQGCIQSIRVRASFVGVVLPLLGVLAFAEVEPARYPMQVQQVITAMGERHLNMEGVQVKLAARMSSTLPAPQLEIRSIVMLDQHHAQLRVACRKSVECLPFYASASWPEDGPAVELSYSKTLPVEIRSLGRAAKEEHVHHESAQSQIALKIGTPATLIIDDNRIHIRLKVVCLQSGTAGDKVRVATTDHKQAYLGEVISLNLLKGSL